MPRAEKAWVYGMSVGRGMVGGWLCVLMDAGPSIMWGNLKIVALFDSGWVECMGNVGY